jgi:hypothetical protein
MPKIMHKKINVKAQNRYNGEKKLVTYKQINYLNHLNQQIKYPRLATWVWERAERLMECKPRCTMLVGYIDMYIF